MQSSSAGDGEAPTPNFRAVSQAAFQFLFLQGSLARGSEEGLLIGALALVWG